MTPIVNRPVRNARRSPFDGLRVSGWHCAAAILPLMLSSSKHERTGCRRAVSPRCLSVLLLVAALLLSTGSAIAQQARPSFPPEFVAQLKGADEIHVATVRKDGTRSSVVPVWFGWMDDAIWFTTSPTSHKAKRIQRGSPLFVSATGKDGPFIKTKAEIIRDGAVADRLGELYKDKYWIAWMGFFRPSASRNESGKTILLRLTPMP